MLIETPARVEHSASGIIFRRIFLRPWAYEHDDDVIIMNESQRCASDPVQRASTKFISMIDQTGHSDRSTSRSKQLKETTMLKKISAALIAASMFAAPAMAASTVKTETAPITKSVAPAAKLQVKPSVRNANARMGRHHHRHYSHHRSHKTVSAYKVNKVSKTNNVSKVTVKPVGPAIKRG
jgi:hypothetical protein